MSLRQIRKLRKESSIEIESKAPIKLEYNNKPNRFSFGLLEDSDSSSESDDDEDRSKIIPKINEVKEVEDKLNDTSSDSDWEKLLEVNSSPSNSEKVSNAVDKHFLYSSPQQFRYVGVVGKTKRTVKSSSNRNWLSPDLDPKESRNLRILCLKQLSIEVSDDELDTFAVHLTNFYREVDEVCSTAINSQDLELFRRIFDSQPYHIGILVRASSINTLINKHEEAFAYLNMGIKMLQSVLPSKFSLSRINCKGLPNVHMPCNLNDNIVVYRLLLLYMISLQRQGQWTVALSICKLLIAMDFPNDSSHSLLHIDTLLLNCYDKNDYIPILKFSYDYSKLTLNLPPLFWYLPNFSLSLALQIFVKQHSVNVNLDYIGIKFIKDNLKSLLNLKDDRYGIKFNPMEYNEHQKLLKSFGVYSPHLILLRALLQFPDFIKQMHNKYPTNSDLKKCTLEYPFNEDEYREYTHTSQSISYPLEVQYNSSSTRRPTRGPAVSSSNYLPVNGRATPGDRGEGEVSDGSSIMEMMEDGSKDVLVVTSSGQPGSDLRELEGEVNREAVCKTTSGVDNVRTSSGIEGCIDLECECDVLFDQLLYCYVVKSGELWMGNNMRFLIDTATLLIHLFKDEESKILLESFQMLWSAFILDLQLPKFLYDVTGTEFDLSNYSLPTSIEFAL